MTLTLVTVNVLVTELLAVAEVLILIAGCTTTPRNSSPTIAVFSGTVIGNGSL